MMVETLHSPPHPFTGRLAVPAGPEHDDRRTLPRSRLSVPNAVHNDDDFEWLPPRLEREQGPLWGGSEPVLLVPCGDHDADPRERPVRRRHYRQPLEVALFAPSNRFDV